MPTTCSFERSEGGNAVYTPHYGAPEIVQGRDQSRPRTDCWAFAVMAFGTLALCHPFIGKKVLEPVNDEGGWDAEPAADDAPADLYEQAYAGYLPFIDDDDDDTNAAAFRSPPRTGGNAGTSPPFPGNLWRGQDTTASPPSDGVLGIGISQGLRPIVKLPGLRNELFRRQP